MAKKHAPKGPVKSRAEKDAKRRARERRNLMDALDSKTDRWRCTARNRLGVRCGRAPIVGGTVCKFHGGGAPQVQLAALDRLRALQPKALVVLEDLLEREEYPTVQIAAVRDILDRTEGKAAETVTVKNITDQPLEKMSDEELARVAEEGLERWKRHVAARDRDRQ